MGDAAAVRAEPNGNAPPPAEDRVGLESKEPSSMVHIQRKNFVRPHPRGVLPVGANAEPHPRRYTGAYLGQALKFAAGAVEPGGR